MLRAKRYLAQLKPDIVIATHATPLGIMEQYKIEKPELPLYAVIPDYNINAGENINVKAGNYDINAETGYVMLGDIVISLETAIRQADNFGHSLEREIGFLTVHSMLHLLGYDHERNDAEEKIMFEVQDKIMNLLNISRDN